MKIMINILLSVCQSSSTRLAIFKSKVTLESLNKTNETLYKKYLHI